MSKCFFILIVFSSIHISFAQKKQPFIVDNSYNIHHYTLKDGLSQVSINNIIEDKNGFIWVATQAGLNRFDGTSFKSYQNIIANQNSLCGNFIHTILADQNKICI